ncbi:MAG: hypothetical protein CVU55_08160 [Deltaproteobacteria bacterium HGW-Deltaproteobacteria-13]|jgi:MSHA pilin protein MshC|nr:MAG: hypothetical protein CVU55_08160 [Deltaproteobacteria bacterium HGW-Deltaproteobacteria-13]
MKRAVKQINGHGGFTMIEVISVLVIIGIIAVVAIVRMTSTANYDLASQVEVVKAHLRLAQVRAMNSGTINNPSTYWGINFSATSYYLFKGVGSTTPVLIPGENDATVNLTTKKSRLTITPNIIIFDAYGSPVDTSGIPVTANITLATNCGNITPNCGAITITKNSGFIP